MNLIQAKIPSSGESLPRLGLGSYRNFDCEPESAAGQGVAKVLKHFAAQGGRLVDSSPMYGKSEACLGTLSTELGLNTGLFVATKVWTQGADSGREQMLASLEKLGRNKIELMQVHNLSVVSG